ncbi:hypothetical protein D3C78_1452260 [compost metagenome]
MGSNKGLGDLFLACLLGLFDVTGKHFPRCFAVLFHTVYSGVNGNRTLSNKRLNVVICLAECQ